MSIFEYAPEELLGTVESVDTSTVIVKVASKSFSLHSKL